MSQSGRKMIVITKQYRLWLVALFCTLCAVCLGYKWCFPKYCCVKFDYVLSHQNTSCRVEAKARHATERSLSSLLRRGSGTASFRVRGKRLDKIHLIFSKFNGSLEISNLTIQGRNTVTLNQRWKLKVQHAKSSALSQDNKIILDNAGVQGARVECRLPIPVRGSRSIHWSNLLTTAGCACFLIWACGDMWRRRKLQPAPLKTPELVNIEFLRVAFTLMVVLRHIAIMCPAACNTGEQGVQFFFLLSGYLLFLTYRPDRSLASFAVNKLIRFVPLVILGCVLSGAGVESLKSVFCLQGTGLLTRDVALNQPA